MKTTPWLKKQRGAISILGAASIALSLYGFDQVLEYGNAKILDRELDNYARTIASVALRSELALTKAGIDSGSMVVNQTDLITNQHLAQVSMNTDSEAAGYNLIKKITFGNFADDSICNSSDPEVRKGCFIPLATDASNPRAAATPLDFSAVAVQLTSTDSFMGIYTPEGQALYGMSLDDQNSDAGCYCKNRYNTCLDMDLTTADLAPIPTSDAALIAVKGSVERQNYCNYGYTQSKPTDSTVTKYPYVEFNDAWIGRPPQTVNFFMFYSTSYDGEAFDDILNHKPVAVTEGDDPLKYTSGFATLFSSFFCFFGCSSADLVAEDHSQNAFEKSDITPSASQADYRCEKPGFFMFPTTYPSCDSASSSNDVVLEDSIYVGYQGTCVSGTTSANDMSRCLSYNDGATSRYESCLEIERRSSMSMNFFERMMAFFMGPFLNWERSYEGLNCEMQKMQYKGWLFWGGWEDV